MLILNTIPGDSVSYSLKCSLVPDKLHLVVVKSSRITVYESAQLSTCLLDTSINARIGQIAVLPKYNKNNTDAILFTTEKYDLVVVKFENHAFKTVFNTSIEDTCGRPCDSGHLVSIDPLKRCVALHIYQGLVKIIPLYHSSSKDFIPLTSTKKAKNPLQFGDPGQLIDLRLYELIVLDIAFLESSHEYPLMGVLYQDHADNRHFVCYSINIQQQKLEKTTIIQMKVDKSTCKIIPVALNQGEFSWIY
jgi:DNA damage-binding protein 1